MGFRRAAVAAVALGAAFSLPSSAQFETRATFSVGLTSPYSLVVGDFSGDGALDLAVVTNYPTGGVQILLGNGDGTFRQGAIYSVAVFPWHVAAGSLRNNGILDLVVSDKLSDDVWVMLGNGDGTFQPAVAYPVTAESYTVALGRFTASGNLDIVALEGTTTEGDPCDCVEVLPGNGNGTFGAPITTLPPYGMSDDAMALGDFKNDGKLDLAVSGQRFQDYLVAILLGNGDGTFVDDGGYKVSNGPYSVTTGAFTPNKDQIDLAVANLEGGSLSVLLGDGRGKFEAAVDYDTYSPIWVIAQDFDGDGKSDLAATDEPASENKTGVSIFKGNGDGTFQTGVFYPVEEGAGFVATGDFNGDGKPDLVTVGSDHGNIVTLLNTGVVSFSPTTPLNFKMQSVGTTSAAQSVTLTNTGTAELKIQSMKASAEFAVISTCGERLAAGADCTISATFSPTKKGAVQGTISLIDSASSKPQVIELFGTGT